MMYSSHKTVDQTKTNHQCKVSSMLKNDSYSDNNNNNDYDSDNVKNENNLLQCATRVKKNQRIPNPKVLLVFWVFLYWFLSSSKDGTPVLLRTVWGNRTYALM